MIEIANRYFPFLLYGRIVGAEKPLSDKADRE